MTTVHDLPRGAMPQDTELDVPRAAHVYWLRLADVATPDLALGFLTDACGCGGRDVPAAIWYDDAHLAALGARIGGALAAQDAVLVLDVAGADASDPRWSACWAAIGAEARVISIELLALDEPSHTGFTADDRVRELDARWRRTPEPGDNTWQHAVALTRLVRLAIRIGAVEWAAEILAGPSVARIRRASPALIERLAAETLAAAPASPLHAVVLADLRAAHWFEAGRVPEAIDLYRAAVELARQAGEPRLECHALGNLGNALAAVDARAAEACFDEAIALARREDLIDEELIHLNNLCVTLMEAGELERAGEAFDFAIRRVDETRRWQTFGNVIVGNLGTLYGRTEHWQMASTFLRRAMDVAVAGDDTALWSSWLANLVGVLRAGGTDAFDAELVAYADEQQRRAARPS